MNATQLNAALSEANSSAFRTIQLMLAENFKAPLSDIDDEAVAVIRGATPKQIESASQRGVSLFRLAPHVIQISVSRGIESLPTIPDALTTRQQQLIQYFNFTLLAVLRDSLRSNPAHTMTSFSLRCGKTMSQIRDMTPQHMCHFAMQPEPIFSLIFRTAQNLRSFLYAPDSETTGVMNAFMATTVRQGLYTQPSAN